MNLGVQSYAELFTTLFGWQQYELLWDIFTHTGLAYVPFVVLFVRHLALPSTHPADPFGVQRVLWEGLAMMLVVVFVAQPMISLNASVLHYRTSCETVVQEVFPGRSHTTFDDHFPVPTSVKVPVFWFAVMAISQGITTAARTGLGCPVALREMMTVVDITSLHDPQLRQELNQFYNQCFLPARQRLFTIKRTLTAHEYNALFQEFVSAHGADDLHWFGSHAFSSVPGFYDVFYAQQAVQGFAYDPKRDWQAGQLSSTPPTWGRPSCQDWWLQSKQGLQTRIKEALPVSWLERFWQQLTQKNKDTILKRLISDVPTGYEAANQSINHWFPSLASTLGVTLKQAQVYPKLYALLQAAPMVRALLLMLVYAFLPVALMLGGYRMKMVVAGAFFIFGIIFWEYLWAWVHWVDDALINALYQDFFDRQQAQAKLVDWMVIALVVVAPLFWFSFMGALGIAAGNLSHVMVSNLTQEGEGASKQGGQLVQSTAMSAARGGVGVATKLMGK